MVRFIVEEGRMVVARGWGSGKWEVLFDEYKVFYLNVPTSQKTKTVQQILLLKRISSTNLQILMKYKIVFYAKKAYIWNLERW